MALEVKHDGSGARDIKENCCACYAKTSYWYTPKDVALCKICAAGKTHDEIPSKQEWCDAVALKFPHLSSRTSI